MVKTCEHLRLVAKMPGNVNPRSALNYKEVAEILGEDFILPEEIRGFSYSPEEREILEENLPRAGVIHWCHANNVVLLPGPSREVTFLEIHKANQEHFFCKGPAWFSSEPFAKGETVTPGWLLLSKRPLVNSNGRTFRMQKKMVSSPLEIPRVVDLTWGFVAYLQARGKESIRYPLVKTGSLTSEGFPVVEGFIHRGGIEVYDWDASKSRDVYITTGYKF